MAIGFSRHVSNKNIVLFIIPAVISDFIKYSFVETAEIAFVAIVTIILIQSRLFLEHRSSQLIGIKFFIFVKHIFFLVFVFEFLIKLVYLILKLLLMGVEDLVYFLVAHVNRVLFVLDKLRC